MTNSGYFVIADISGYTAFLSGSELEHAQGILEALFAALLAELRSPLAVANLEGDAIFAYAPDEGMPQGQLILDAVENLYCAFSAELEKMRRNTTCTCRACGNMGKLDLKLVVHHGSYAVQRMAGRSDLAGTDVILVHRLLKNEVVKSTGIAAYSLFTGAAVAAMAMDEYFAAVPLHVEEYEHVGAVETRVYPMREVWERRRERQRKFVAADDAAAIQSTVDLPLALAHVWSLVREVDNIRKWAPGGVVPAGLDRGRMGIGTALHCAHGADTITLTVVDLQPFESVTFEIPMPLGWICRETIALVPSEAGTRVSDRYLLLSGAAVPSWRQALMRRLTMTKMRRMLATEADATLERLSRAVAEVAALASAIPSPGPSVSPEQLAAMARTKLAAPAFP